jgi:peptide/nickel transport system substrate-binding protein
MTAVVLAFLAALALAQQPGTLRIGLAEDPDILDPDLARTYVGRIVFESLCDKLLNTDSSLNFVPELATAWRFSADGRVLTLDLRSGVVFHDGTPFNAEAVKFNIERSLNLPGSTRRSEIAQVTGVRVTGPLQVALDLSAPFVPLLAQLSDRAGMMVSPAAAQAAGDQFGTRPVCSGPFRFVERVAQDRIVLDRFDRYWNAGQIHFGRVVFRPVVSATTRLANLRAGDFDLIERMAATDLGTVRADPNLELHAVTSLGYQGLTINHANPSPRNTPLARDARVREALELAIDRNVINQVVFDGEFTPGNTPFPPISFYNDGRPIPARNVERARQLLQQAGASNPAFTLMVTNDPQAIRIGEIVQSMAAEAGFRITLDPVEFAAALDRQDAGNYDAFLIGWSGRVDPDGNIHQFLTSTGALNETGYNDPEVNRLLNQARVVADANQRKTLYSQALDRALSARAIVYLYHTSWFFAAHRDLQGFVAHPDGMIRLPGVRLNR